MRNELLRMHLLTALNGVNYPAASAILMFYDRKRYPVLDIRVWQQLYKAGLVHFESTRDRISAFSNGWIT